MKTKTDFIPRLILVLIFIVAAYPNLKAQDAAIFDGNEFGNIMLNDQMPLIDLIGINGDYTRLKNELGQPIDEERNDDKAILGMEPGYTFFYPDVEISYTDVGSGPELVAAEITGPGSHLTYQGVEIRVGDPVSKLQPLFPEAYSLRGPVTNSGVTRYIVSINVAGSITYLTFRYSNTTQTIVEIELWQILT